MSDMTQTGGAAQGVWTGRVTAWKHAINARRARRRIFRQTFAELSTLTDRDLADLGLSRSDIRRVAWQAAQET